MKKLLVILSALLLSMAAAVGTIFLLRYFNEDKNYLTQAEWIDKLAEHSALDKKELARSRDNKAADCGYVAISIMKAMGEHKLNRVLGDVSDYKDEDYLEQALKYGIVDEDSKKNKLKPEDAEKYLKKFDELYYGEFWLDGYCHVTYKEDTQLIESKAYRVNEDSKEVSFPEDVIINEGEIIVFEDEHGFKHAGVVTQVNGNGSYCYETCNPEDILEEIDLSDKVTVDFSDAGSYLNDFDLGEEAYDGDPDSMSIGVNKLKATDFHYENPFDGFGAKLVVEQDETDGRDYLVLYTYQGDNEKIRYKRLAKEGDTGELDVFIDDITVCVDTNFLSFSGKPLYAEFNADTNAVLKGNITLDAEYKFKLFDMNVPFEGGFVRLNVSAYLVITAEGTFEIVVEFPVNVNARYDSGQELHFMKKIGDPIITASLNASVETSLQVQPSLYIFWIWDIMSVNVKGGAVAKGSETIHDDELLCTDISVHFPVVSVGASFNGLLAIVEHEWDIIPATDDNKIFGYHYEIRKKPVRWRGKVPECTYGQEFDENLYGSGRIYSYEDFDDYEVKNVVDKLDDEELVEELQERKDEYEQFKSGSEEFNKYFVPGNYYYFTLENLYGEENMDDEEFSSQDNDYLIYKDGDNYILTGKLELYNGLSGDLYYDIVETYEETGVSSFNVWGVEYNVTSYEVNDMGRGIAVFVSDAGKEYKLSNDLAYFASLNLYFPFGDKEIVLEPFVLVIPESVVKGECMKEDYYPSDQTELIESFINNSSEGKQAYERILVGFDENGVVNYLYISFK